MIRESISNGKNYYLINKFRLIISELDSIHEYINDCDSLCLCDVGLMEKIGIIKSMIESELPNNTLKVVN